MDRLFECVLFLAGLAFGSFLNVCISRIPRDQSVVSPRSHCFTCGSPVRWYDNLPLLSWFLLRGRCRDCQTAFGLRYPVVELLTAVLFTSCYVSFGLSWLTLKFIVFTFLLIGLIFMDAETGLLPREFTYSGIVLGLAFAWIAPFDYSATRFLLGLYNRHWESAQKLSLVDSVLGAIVGAGFFYLAWALYYLVRKKHGIGFGDIALMAMSGAFLGLKLILLVIFFAPLLAVLYAVVVLFRESAGLERKVEDTETDASLDNGPILNRTIAFGVFLGVCSLVAVFLGEGIWTWYLQRF